MWLRPWESSNGSEGKVLEGGKRSTYWPLKTHIMHLGCTHTHIHTHACTDTNRLTVGRYIKAHVKKTCEHLKWHTHILYPLKVRNACTCTQIICCVVIASLLLYSALPWAVCVCVCVCVCVWVCVCVCACVRVCVCVSVSATLTCPSLDYTELYMHNKNAN